MTLLAQMGGAAQGAGGPVEAVPRLPDPPLLSHALLESPWAPAALLVGAGIVVFYTLNRGGKAREGLRWLGGLGLAALALVGVASLVTTEREALQDRTRALVDATATADTVELGGMLASDVRVGPYSGNYSAQFGGASGREAVLDAVRRYMGEQFPLAEHGVKETQAVIDGPNLARTQVHVWVTARKGSAGDVLGGTTGSWVRVGWRRDGDGPWKVASVSVLQIDFVGLNRQGE